MIDPEVNIQFPGLRECVDLNDRTGVFMSADKLPTTRWKRRYADVLIDQVPADLERDPEALDVLAGHLDEVRMRAIAQRLYYRYYAHTDLADAEYLTCETAHPVGDESGDVPEMMHEHELRGLDQ